MKIIQHHQGKYKDI